jgi:hypothetical protein
MEYNQNIVASKLKKMPENDVTRRFIIPLLESLGYFKVEFFGGTSEGGKDILCWEIDKMEELRLTVAQVKHFKYTNRASDSKSLQTIINQLTTCFTNGMPFTDKTIHYPSEAILISTYEIDTKTLLSRFGTLPNLWDQRIRIIDGLKLVSMLISKQPELVNELLGIDIEISTKILPKLNNEILLSALGYHNKKELKSIYTDIDFSIGKISTELFFNDVFIPKKKRFALNSIEWESFKSVLHKVKNEFNIDFSSNTIFQIESDFKLKDNSYKIWKADLDNLESDLYEKRKALDNVISEIGNKNEEFNRWEKENGNERLIKLKEVSKKERIKISEKLNLEYIRVANNHKMVINNLELDEDHCKNSFNKIKESIVEYRKKEAIPYYEFEFDGNLITKEIKDKRRWIEEQVTFYNAMKGTYPDIKDFILNCKSIIDSASIIFNHKDLLECLFDANFKIIRNNFESTRLKIPIDKIFDTEQNIAVLGEAGAGKTTCLQMYVLSKQYDNSKDYLWLPLSRVIHDWEKKETNVSKIFNKPGLISGIANYLSNLGIPASHKDVEKLFESRKVVLLLDGIDEAIKIYPLLLHDIKTLSDTYSKNLQIIVSSRMSGSYLNEIPFFTVTLLPFTAEQRNIFIERWFDKDRQDIVLKIKNHLEKSKAVSEIVKNPLLTTTLCVIAENEIPLPSTEIKLYNERINLLTGYYDNVKNIISRIASTPNSLENLAQNLAFTLHSMGKREEDYKSLEEISVKLMLNKLSIKGTHDALNELIDPCNILVPMTEDGKFGFGHLRYQEHLAAKLIMSNRSIDIIPLLNQSWWRGVLILFSKMNDSIDWLIKDLGVKLRVTNSRDALTELINARPKHEKEKLFAMLEKFLAIEDYERVIRLKEEEEDELL